MSATLEAEIGLQTLHRTCPLCEQDNRHVTPSRFSQDDWRLKRCSQCTLLYLENPLPYAAYVSDHSWSNSFPKLDQQRHNNRSLQSRVRTKWVQIRTRLLPHNKVASLVRKYVPSGNLLDVGCSQGLLFTQFSPRIVPHGIEIDERAAKLAQQRAAERGGIVYQTDAVQGLRQIAAGSMSAILMIAYLEHEIEPLAVLRAARDVLHRDGVIIIKVPNFACWNRHLRGAHWPGFRYPDHVNYFTPQLLTQMIRKAGLEIRQFAWHDWIPTSDNMWMVARRAS